MATGMVNSAQTLNSPILRAGERLASTPAALADKNAKVYKHMLPGARFIMPDGLEIVFLGGQFATTDKAIIEELDKVANKTASLIFTDNATAAAISTAAQKAAADAGDTAGKLNS